MHPLGTRLALLVSYVLGVSGAASSYLLRMYFCAARCLSGEEVPCYFDASTRKKLRAAPPLFVGRKWLCLIVSLCEHTFALYVASVTKKHRTASMHPFGRWFCAVRHISGDGQWRCFDALTRNTLGTVPSLRVGGKWCLFLINRECAFALHVASVV